MKHSLRFQIFFLTTVRILLNTAHRMVYPFLPAFGRGLGVDLPALSLALTGRSAVGLLGPFLASISDNRGRKTGLVVGFLLFTAGVSVVAAWPTFPGFVVGLILAAMSKYVFDPALQAYLGDLVPYERRGLAVAASEVSWSLSFMAGVPLVGLLIARSGWQAPFPIFAGLGLLISAALAWLIPDDRPAAQKGGQLWINLRSVFAYPPAVAGLLVGVLVSSANEIINLVFGVWMEQSFGVKILALGAASAVIGLAELGGESLVGALSDRMGKARAVGVGVVLNSLAVLALPLFGRSIPGALVGLFLFYLTFEFTLVSTLPLMTEILPHARATLMATNVAGLSLGRAIGDLVASPLYLAGQASGLVSGILLSALATALLNLLALAALRTLHALEVSGEEIGIKGSGGAV